LSSMTGMDGIMAKPLYGDSPIFLNATSMIATWYSVQSCITSTGFGLRSILPVLYADMLFFFKSCHNTCIEDIYGEVFCRQDINHQQLWIEGETWLSLSISLSISCSLSPLFTPFWAGSGCVPRAALLGELNRLFLWSSSLNTAQLAEIRDDPHQFPGKEHSCSLLFIDNGHTASLDDRRESP
jgi:hypothetical protein